MSAPEKFSEADLCAAFIALAQAPSRWSREPSEWIAYPETAGFDILMVRASDGAQIGIEAKLVLNPKVIAQALPYRERWYFGDSVGPDYRAVLVPAERCNEDLVRICDALGITVIRYRAPYKRPWGEMSESAFSPDLPHAFRCEDWHQWAPVSRCKVPDYIPDVAAGRSAPIALTPWKVNAIKIVILASERPVTRADFKHFRISPTPWLCPRGWLDRVPDTRPGQWVAGERTPDFEVQHPRNFHEIKADKALWMPAAPPLMQQLSTKET